MPDDNNMTLPQVLEATLTEDQADILLNFYVVENLNIDADTWSRMTSYRKLAYAMMNGWKLDMRRPLPELRTPQEQKSLLKDEAIPTKLKTPQADKTIPPKTATQTII